MSEAADQAGPIAEVLYQHRETGSTRRMTELGCTCGAWVEDFRRHIAEALVADGIGVLPEAEVTEEWGVRQDAKVYAMPSREAADYNASRVDEDHAVRRTRTRYAEHITEWEAVDE